MLFFCLLVLVIKCHAWYRRMARNYVHDRVQRFVGTDKVCILHMKYKRFYPHDCHQFYN